MTTTKERKREFTIELIKFFKSSVCGTADSINTLAKIQDKFPEEYKEFREVRVNPMNVDKFMEKLSQEEKDTFLIIFARASYIAPRLNKLFESTLAEKKQLAEDINSFAEFVESKLTKLVKKKGK